MEEVLMLRALGRQYEVCAVIWARLIRDVVKVGRLLYLDGCIDWEKIVLNVQLLIRLVIT
jgi:hypothetical protein